MAKKKSKTDEVSKDKPPKKTDSSKKDKPSKEEDTFHNLVLSCVEAYEKLGNDSLALDFCKVSDRKLRSMILNDEEYKAETKNIYARQRLEEVEEIEYLSSLAANGGMEPGEEEEDEDEDYYEPRDGPKKPKKPTAIEKEFLNMRFKAAQMKRELRAELAKTEGDVERDSALFYFEAVTKEELEALLVVEIHEGTEEVDMDELLDRKEEIPDGTGKTRIKGKTSVPGKEEPYEIVLEDGEVVEL